MSSLYRIIKQTSRSARKLGHYCEHVTTGSTVGLFTTLYLQSRHCAEEHTHTRVHAHCLFWPCTFTLRSSALRVCLCVSGTPCLAHTPCVLEGRTRHVMIHPSRFPPPYPYSPSMSASLWNYLGLSITSATHKRTHSSAFCSPAALHFISNRGHFIRIVWSSVTQLFVNARRCAA